MNERNENNQNVLDPKGGIQEGASERAGEKSDAAGGFGQLLRAERLKRGLSINEVARRLHLSAQQIHAIEEEDFSKLPSGTYLRGFIKNYSNLLQLDTNAMLRLLTQSAPVASRQSILKSSSTVPLTVSKRSYSGRRGLGAIMVLMLALLGYGIYQGGDWEQESVTIFKEPSGDLPNSQTEQGQVTMELLLPQSSLAPLPSLEKQPVPEARSPEFGIAPATPSVIEPPVVESPVSSDKTLHLSFSKDSWVEIRDSDKKVIFVKTNPKGTEQVITGVPPFYLVIGNASGVNLTYNGRSVDMTPYTRKSDDVARFSLE